VAADLKKAFGEKRTIVFIDESGLSERHHRVRTWAPRGQTPVLSAVLCQCEPEPVRCGAMKILWLLNRTRTSHLQTECPWCESESGFKKGNPS
jgi:hypothetical protein